MALDSWLAVRELFSSSSSDLSLGRYSVHDMMRCRGEVAEWSIAAVLKTVEGNTSGGSNPSLSAS